MLEIRVQVIPPLSEVNYKKIGQAVHEAGEMVEQVMKAALSGKLVPGMTRPVSDAKLANGVTRNDLGLFEFSVKAPDGISSVENEKQPWDMKPALIHGPRSRALKDGAGRYNIIPFKHEANDLPEAVAELASALTISQIIGTYMDDEKKVRNVYWWGGNTGDTSAWMPIETKPQMGGMSRPYTHKASKGSNMYSFPSGYVTFRTVSSHSPQESWWHPGYAENPIVESIEKFVRPMVEAHIAAAWIEELDRW